MNRRRLALFAVAALAAAATFTVTAQDKTTEEIRLVLGRSRVIQTDREIRRLAIGDPGVVSVVVLDSREILINAKRTGRTNLLLWYADKEREERLCVVEQDLKLLREHLARIDASIVVDTSSDGQSVILRGSVSTFDMMRAAVDVTARFLEGSAVATGSGIVIEAKKEGPEQPKPDEKVAQTSVPASSARIRNLLAVRELPASLEQRLEEAIKAFSRDIKLRRVQQGPAPVDATDAFVLEGSIRSQSAYTQLLAVVDKMLGGTGEAFKVVADSSGGLFTGSARSAAPTSQLGGGGGGTLVPNDLATNIGRASIVRTSSGRLLSFVKVLNIPQVLVSVRVLEIDRSKARAVGVNWNATQKDFNFGSASVPNSILPEVSDVMSVLNGLLTNTVTVIDSRYTLTQTLSLLESNDLLRTLAEPNLMTLSGEVASFLVGGEVPVQQVTSTTTAALAGFEFREFGIRLSIRPVVADDGTITIDIAPDISTVPSFTPAGAPNFKRTSLQTSAMLKGDQGIVVGGLISVDEQEKTSQIPILGDIPILGALFRKTETSHKERELAIVLLPKVVMPKPSTSFALEAPPPEFSVRAGSFLDPELGTLPSVPRFFYKNAAEGERVPEDK
ncbi:MAG TPA: pilus assembly protein N-terminal domain-containing protein [Planctomycetota bacterium]|nr:pilus assembly protein N-terminal domain-containing protein [Planctomycetota bacterium]